MKEWSKSRLSYFIAAYFSEDYFLKNITKKELVIILQKLFPHSFKDSPRPFSDMCKKRMIKHIKFYCDMHNFSNHPKEFWEELYIWKTEQEENKT